MVAPHVAGTGRHSMSLIFHNMQLQLHILMRLSTMVRNRQQHVMGKGMDTSLVTQIVLENHFYTPIHIDNIRLNYLLR